MRYRNSKPALILRWATLAMIVLTVVLSHGDCLIKTEGLLWDDPDFNVTFNSMNLGETQYIMLAAALLLILRHYISDILSALLLTLPTLILLTIRDLMSIVAGGIEPGSSYEYTPLGIVVVVLAGISLLAVWFMALVLKQSPKQVTETGSDAEPNKKPREKNIKTVIVVGILVLLVIIFRDAIVNMLQELLRGIW